MFCNCKNCLRNTQNLKNISPSKKQKQCIRFPSLMRNINRSSFWFRAIKLVHKKSYPLNEFSLTFWLTPVLLRLAAVHYRDYDWNYLWTDDGQMWWNLSKKALVCICRVTIDFKQNLKKKWKLKIYDFKELQTWQGHCQINNACASSFSLFHWQTACLSCAKP